MSHRDGLNLVRPSPSGRWSGLADTVRLISRKVQATVVRVVDHDLGHHFAHDKLAHVGYLNLSMCWVNSFSPAIRVRLYVTANGWKPALIMPSMVRVGMHACFADIASYGRRRTAAFATCHR